MFFFGIGVSIAPGHEGVPAFSDSNLSGHRKPSSSEEYLAGAVSHHQRAPHIGW